MIEGSHTPNPKHHCRSTSYLPHFLLIIFVFISYLLFPVQQYTDSRYTLLFSELMITQQSLALESLKQSDDDSSQLYDEITGSNPRHIQFVDGSALPYFPFTNAVFALPFYIPFTIFAEGLSYSSHSKMLSLEAKYQKIIASALSSIVVLVMFLIARTRISTRGAILAALLAAFGTQLASTTSRGLWTHNWSILFTSTALLILMKLESRESQLKHQSLCILTTGMLFTLSYLARPTGLIGLIVVLLYIIIRYSKKGLFFYLLGAFVVLLPFIAMSNHYYGSLFPPYYQGGRLSLEGIYDGIIGNLISPSRGLLIYLPFLLPLGILAAYKWKSLFSCKLSVTIFITLTLLFLGISAFPHWWGGYSYGPRLQSDLLPWLYTISVFVLSTPKGKDCSKENAQDFIKYSFYSSAVLSVIVHLYGATSIVSWKWNELPKPVDAYPERLWDWKNPQLLSSWTNASPPANLPEIAVGESVKFAEKFGGPLLWNGWDVYPSEAAIWTDGLSSQIIFSSDIGSNAELILTGRPFVYPGYIDSQSIELLVNGKEVFEGELDFGEIAPLRFPLPGSDDNRYIVELNVPTAKSPQELGINSDKRVMGYLLSELRIIASDLQ